MRFDPVNLWTSMDGMDVLACNSFEISAISCIGLTLGMSSGVARGGHGGHAPPNFW